MNNKLHPNAQYMFQHLHKAVTALVIGEGDIRERMTIAGQHYMSMAITALPSHLQNQAQEIKDYLTEYKAEPNASFPYDSDIKVTMKKRRKNTASKMASKMWSLYHQYQEILNEK